MDFEAKAREWLSSQDDLTQPTIERLHAEKGKPVPHFVLDAAIQFDAEKVVALAAFAREAYEAGAKSEAAMWELQKLGQEIEKG